MAHPWLNPKGLENRVRVRVKQHGDRFAIEYRAPNGASALVFLKKNVTRTDAEEAAYKARKIDYAQATSENIRATLADFLD